MNVLAILLLVSAAGIFLAGRVLARRQEAASRRLFERLEDAADEEIDEDEKIDEDFYRLLNTVSGVFRGIALALAGLAAVLALWAWLQ